MPREISGRCIAHSNELASDLCSTCGDEFCAGCLVGTTSSKRSLCVGCALAASGVRSTARKRVRPIGARELRKRRELSERVRRDAMAHNALIDRSPWKVLNGPKPGSRVDQERTHRDLLEPAISAHSAVDPELTAAGFASRAAMELPPIEPLSDRRRIEPLADPRRAEPLAGVDRRATPAPAAPTPVAPAPRIVTAPRVQVAPVPAEPAPVAAHTDAPARSLARVWTSQGTVTAAPHAATPRPPAAATAPAPPWRRRNRTETPAAEASEPEPEPTVASAPVADLTEPPVLLGTSPWSTPPRPTAADPATDDHVPAGGSYRPSAWAGLTADGHGDRPGGSTMPMRTPRFTGSRLG